MINSNNFFYPDNLSYGLKIQRVKCSKGSNVQGVQKVQRVQGFKRVKVVQLV